ncbi:Hypothetical predicted protein [Pelobates cultripes]|uniref:Uncharacterized protein n=1 Tax=Pelobates cultripes TaxID=61616 RepID=A0AAD1R3P0_PELCU|nr:Hypothetical predicted protein [Pelobates cultripes]
MPHGSQHLTVLEDILVRLDNRFLEFWRLESMMSVPAAVQPTAPSQQSPKRKPAAPPRRKHPSQRLCKRQAQLKRRTSRRLPTRMLNATRKITQRSALPKTRQTTTVLQHYHQAHTGHTLQKLTGRPVHHLPRRGID